MTQQSREGLPEYTPWTDMMEREDGMHILLDMPGVSKESLEVDVDKDQLRISGATSYPADPFAASSERASHVEFGGGRYVRTFTLADEVDREGITATLKNGMLDVHLPTSKASKSRRINVQAG